MEEGRTRCHEREGWRLGRFVAYSLSNLICVSLSW
ncbi:unnamed protein product [Spirodela intermedia]|uniref:Uncharacterized protein n=1 Tax=Spirodela intermedia TaxID=51605 RepID=A0A7I8L2T4_SPIIN|nr:unnamed protein product [Spirodela intermedia]